MQDGVIRMERERYGRREELERVNEMEREMNQDINTEGNASGSDGRG